MSSSIAFVQSTSNKEYGNLLQVIQPHKIESEQDYDRFVSVVETLLEKEESSELSEQEAMLVELLIVLIQDYDRENVSFPASKPLDILIHLMESNNLRQSDLVGIVGSSGVVSEVLNGKREISKAHAHSLGQFFSVSYKLFL